MMYRSLAALSFAATVLGQQVGTNTAETHPSMPIKSCTASGCTTETTKVVLDANWRWAHATTGYTNCYTGNAWNATICPDAKTCAANCAIDGADYVSTYGVSTPSSGALQLKFVTTNANGANVGSRLYLMADDTNYRMFNLLNKEFTFDVDVSKLPCGLNGAVYFSEMEADGGLAKNPGNKAGAKYGTGYCDSQCPRDLKFINGAANVVGWDGTSPNSGNGDFGSCCAEMDIWEANLDSAAYTPHPCSPEGLTQCTDGVDCTTICDQAGCDFNSFRQGNQDFYGTGKTVDTSKPFTLVTQFITDDGTDTGNLAEIKRFYVQGGVTIANSQSTVAGVTGNSITDSYCAAQKTAFGDTNTFAAKGGLKSMGESFKTGMVLVLSVWDDYAVSMNWLDSNYPPTADPAAPGVLRGRCDNTVGLPATVEKDHADATVLYSNIKVGSLGSTFAAPAGGSPPAGGSSSSSTAAATATSSTAATPTGACASLYGQCGGTGWAGATCCSAGSCKSSNQYYAQCLS